jgi:uncharacterized protein YkwD
MSARHPRLATRAAFAATLIAAAAGVLAGAAQAHPSIVPPAAGARSYFAPSPAGAGAEMLTDSLARGLWHAIGDAAEAQRRKPPEPDARLHAVAEVLAATLGRGQVPGLEMQEFLLAHHGLGDPVPELFMLQMGVEDDFIRDRLVASISRALAATSFQRVGIGVHRRWFRKCVVVALQRVEVELLPIPRRLPAGGSALIGGRFSQGLWRPTVLVAPPAGPVRDLPLRSTSGSFQTSFRCDAGPGRYQVEVMGTGRGGKTLAANFPLFCDVAPPRAGPLVTIAGPESSDPRRGEELLLEAVNRDRKQAGVPPVSWDEPLARVARVYSAEMAETELVDHRSRRSGNAADRVRRAGARADIVLENVARANSIADAQRSFMSSPGHRSNVLDRGVTRMGAGVVMRREPGGVHSLYVTQLFSR